MHLRGRVAKPFVSPDTSSPTVLVYVRICCFFSADGSTSLCSSLLSLEADVLVKTPYSQCDCPASVYII